MSSRSITSAIYKKNSSIYEEISIDALTKELYKNIYRNHLFCPTEGCNARLKFVTRKSGSVKLLSAIDISEHAEGCPYYHEYVKYDSEEKVNKFFSEEHIINSLKRQFKQFGVKCLPRNIDFHSYSHRSKAMSNEPTIQFYDCNVVDARLEHKAISIGGFVHSIKINDKDLSKIHAYINFQMSNSNRVKVLISNNCYKKYSKTAELVNKIDETWKATPADQYFTCICFGFVQKVANGINVVPANLNSIFYGYKDV